MQNKDIEQDKQFQLMNQQLDITRKDLAAAFERIDELRLKQTDTDYAVNGVVRPRLHDLARWANLLKWQVEDISEIKHNEREFKFTDLEK